MTLDPDPLRVDEDEPLLSDGYRRTSLSEVAMILAAIALVAAIVVAVSKA